MLVLSLEYLAFVSVAAVGVIQWATAKNQLKGLWFFSTRLGCYLLSALLLALSFSWFFLSKDRIRQGVEGVQQFYLFISAAALALVFTLLLSSLLRGRRGASLTGKVEPGLETLKEMSYLEALRRSFGRNRKQDVANKGG